MTKNSRLNYQPIVIIGSGRSGTNMLRNILTAIPEVSTWPCDEINYIWRHGNIRESSDEFTPEMATENACLFIRSKFNEIANTKHCSYLVEKTCANALRVGFIDRVIPEAKFIHIIRDGRDVVASAQKRWSAPLDIPYLFKKARFVPLSDLPHYASKYLVNRLYRMRSAEGRLSSWGPRYIGLEKDLSQYSLPEVCAIQWKMCVEKASEELSLIKPSRVYRLCYETFVANPKAELLKILNFLDLSVEQPLIDDLVRGVSKHSVGKWKQELDPSTASKIHTLIHETLCNQGYL